MDQRLSVRQAGAIFRAYIKFTGSIST